MNESRLDARTCPRTTNAFVREDRIETSPKVTVSIAANGPISVGLTVPSPPALDTASRKLRSRALRNAVVSSLDHVQGMYMPLH